MPEAGRYATGILFVDKDVEKARKAETMFEQLAQQSSLQVNIWSGSQKIVPLYRADYQFPALS